MKDMISVAMGVRCSDDDSTHLEQAVRSILNQRYENLELLICRNGSGVQANRLLMEIANQDARVRLLDDGADTPMASGLISDLAARLNRCIGAARGDYVARMDDDDVSFPERLERQMAYLHDHPEIAFVGSNVELIQNEASAGMRVLPEHPTVKDFLFVQPFIHPALMFRKDALIAVGGYCEALRCGGCEDYDLLLRLYELEYRGANLRTPCLRYRLPDIGKKKRTFHARVNEMKTRYIRFRSLGLLPKALPYVVKPIAVGFLPEAVLRKLKDMRR